MKPTLTHWNQFEILEKISAGKPIDDILLKKELHYYDNKTGEFLYPVTTHWEPEYVLEAFINGIELILLSEQIDLVMPASMLNFRCYKEIHTMSMPI